MKHTRKIMISLLLLTGLFSLAQTGITYSDSILSNSIYRRYKLYVPVSYTNTNAVPLLFNLHGYTSNASQQQPYSNFMPIADTANFIMVLPEGTAPAGSQYFNAGFGPGANDLLFMNDLIDSLSLAYNINPNCIYSCGMSNGGIMSYYLACYSANRFAAVASVTGSMLNSWFTVAPNRPVPVMEIHGTNDATVPYNGDATFANIDSVAKKWAKHNQCNLTPITYSVPNINTTDGATAINYRYTNGTNSADVELYKIINGAHSWPGAPIALGVTCMDFNASLEIWRFFRKYKLNLLTSVTEIRNEESLSVFPNPFSNTLFVSTQDNLHTEVSLIDVLGKPVKTTLFKSKIGSEINTSELPKGFYYLNITVNNKPTKTQKLIKH